MKWVNHIAIAGALTAVFNPQLVPVAILGATAPDWMEWCRNSDIYRKVTGVQGYIRHRAQTHVILTWTLAMFAFAFVWDFNNIGFWFAFGGLSHCLTDGMTAMGVPLTPWSDRKVHVFGGRLRTGQPGEYMVMFGIVGVCFFVATSFQSHDPTGEGFVPFFYNWAGEYENGLIDGSEWRSNRFRLI